jgi:protein TonB
VSRRYVRGLIASLLLHVVLVGAVLTVLPRSEVLPALFVDLTTAAGDAASVEPRERVRAAAAPRASIPAARPARRPEPAASTRSSDDAATRESLPPAATSEPTPPAPAAAPPPAPTSAPAPSPPAAPDDATATASVPVTPAPSSTTSSEEPPSASAALPSASARLNGGDGGSVPPEPTAAPARGGGTLADSATRDDGGPRGRSDGAAATGGGGTGQEIARRSPGSESGEAQAVYKEYLAWLRQRVHEALRYPPAARRRGLTGAVTIELTILPSGLIRDVSVVESSSHTILDEAAVETVRTLRSQPFPRNVPPRTLRVRLPVVFELQ